jgi:hypothetical protein
MNPMKPLGVFLSLSQRLVAPRTKKTPETACGMVMVKLGTMLTPNQ